MLAVRVWLGVAEVDAEPERLGVPVALELELPLGVAVTLGVALWLGLCVAVAVSVWEGVRVPL